MGAAASDNRGVAGVKFLIDGTQIGAEQTASPYTVSWNTTTVANGRHALTAVARDAAGNTTTSAAVSVWASNLTTPVYPLKLVSGQRYIVDQTNTPFLIHGEAAWSLIVNLTNAEVDTYLEDRRQKGVNALIVNLIEHKYAPRPPRNVYGDEPFTVSGDFSTPNEAYFAHVDLVLQKAADKGMVVLLAPAYLGYSGTDQGWFQEMSANGTAKLTSYGQYLGNRYKNFSNIIWLNAGDFNPPTADKALTNAVVSGIKTYDTTHLHTAHCLNGTSPISQWGSFGWLDISNVYTYPVDNNAVPVYQKAASEYSRTDWKPFFLLESTYEGEYSAPQTLLRQQSYEALLSGAFGDFFGNNPIWLFASGWQGALASRGSLDMVNVRSFFNSRHWEKLVPDSAHAFVTAGYGSNGTGRSVAARASDGSWGATYLPTARTITVNLSGFSGTVQAHWYDPTNGAISTVSGSPFANAGSVNITTPGSNNTGTADWLLFFDLL